MQPLNAANAPAAAKDPYLWLEQVSSSDSLKWVLARNKETTEELQADPRYAELRKQALEIMDAKDRIPYVALRNGHVYNFWQDAEHVKGLWRRAPLAEYFKTQPAWETLLDFDKLSKDEGESWVFKGSSCLYPEGRRCFITLSRGGKDASVMREFDTDKKVFVKDGFRLEESKSSLAWQDENTVLFSDALTPGAATAAGYPGLVRKWSRGTPPEKAPVIFKAEKTDMSASGWCGIRPEGSTCLVTRQLSFYESEKFLLTAGGLRKIPVPADADIAQVFKGRLLVSLRSDWQLPGLTFRQNSIVTIKTESAGTPVERVRPELFFEPSDRMTTQGIASAKDFLLLALLDNVKGRILKMTPEGAGWKTEEVAVPANGSADVDAANDFSNDFFFTYQNFLTPTSLYYADGQTGPKVVKRLPAKFSAEGLETAQREAVSRDGTRIPYFLVYPKGMKTDGSNPTLLYGYGGFESSMTPFYAALQGRLWLERGGVYVLANIRGGGEFGPAWHQAALQKKRQNAFDDFIAVAEDLVKTGVTSPRRLGIQGGSNGGLLMGAMFTQRPDLFGAVLCEVPLLDMLRYTKLPPGSTWIAEYGDPDSPEMGPVIAKYSPYQNIRPGVKYPSILFLTSTKDDRVHPGHARKAAARLMEFGNKVYYYENTEGGHSAAADNLERATRAALEYTLLLKKLKD
ncbi:MAG: hypothetical protein A2X35_06500 [Elusimicrobia bacterium GWA2_61_42]|nr:MAG: hypothetical protein A2X35_06500 [Elusimicrobia bacterium GWA2_61_42]OGR78812.1 MAG: hypothetical protein A2X38_04445 [Elusimicrobia bacterium GWC2_61_25]